MDALSQSIRDLAERLLALEAKGSHADAHEALRVCEKLRVSLTRFAGADGVTALLRRALALARADNPLLQNVQVTGDGRLEGCEDLATDNVGMEAMTAVTAHLLGLLATFIGEALMLRLVREAWPDASLDK